VITRRVAGLPVRLTVAELTRTFADLTAAGHLPAPAYFEVAYLHPAWDRADLVPGCGYQGYLNAAAVRELTSGGGHAA
jgi:hypothetical protein